MKRRYRVQLNESERSQLVEIVTKGKHSSRKVRRAQTLLLADEGQTDGSICQTLKTSPSTVERTRKQFVEEGLEATLSEKGRSGRPPRLDARAEATLIATACSSPPQGRERWTIRLLADRVVEMGVVEAIAPETVRQTLKKTRSSRGGRSSGVSPE